MPRRIYTENFPGLATRRKLSDWAIRLDGLLFIIGLLITGSLFSRTSFLIGLALISAGGLAVLTVMINELIQSLRTGITYTDSNGDQPFVTRRDSPNQFWLYFCLRVAIAGFATGIPLALIALAATMQP